MGGVPRNFWEGRRGGRCPLKLFRAVLESWMNSGACFCTLVPWQAGAGGSIGYRLFRGPTIHCLCVWGFGLRVCGYVFGGWDSDFVFRVLGKVCPYSLG